MNLSRTLIRGSGRKVIPNHGRHYAEEATFKTLPYKLYKLSEPPPATSKVTRNDALAMYRKMVTMREMEMSAKAMYRQKLIRGFLHLYIGQEACAVGIFSAMRPVDSLITTYRVHGWAYLFSESLECCLAELTGRQNGISLGKGGSMHMYYERCYGGQGIVGSQTPQGTGIAFAHKYRGDGGVSVTLYGDGAANQGQLFESYNIAKLWSLPCLFVCENNQYAMGTSMKRHAGNLDFYTRGDYIPGLWVDAMDIITVKEAAKFAFEYCSSGKGPLVMEMFTYRYMGHSMSDPDTSYRTRQEIKQVRETRDCINYFRKQILQHQLVTEPDLKKIDEEAKGEVAKAVEASQKEKELPVPELTTDIYVNNIEAAVRGVDPWTSWKTGIRKEFKCAKKHVKNY